MERVMQMAGQVTTSASFNSDIFSHLQQAPADPILGVTQLYKADQDSKKMNLGVGAYRDDNEKPQVFQIVRKVEKELANDNKQDKEYLPIDGYAPFNKLAQQLIFGEGANVIKSGLVQTSQTLSGTGALRVAFEFIAKYLPCDVYVSKPTWGNHHAIIKNAGLKHVDYTYYHAQTRGFDFEGMIKDLQSAKPGSVVLLHPCAHNPTGVDPTIEQWRQIAATMKQNDLIPLFDSAYQGFASGDLHKDAASIRLFVDMGFQMIVTQSFAKNMGLYGERCGAVHFVTKSAETGKKLLSQLKLVIRAMYSSPPMHGAKIAAAILGCPNNFKAWQAELTDVSHRIIKMRQLLRQKLEELKVPGNWSHITTQIGMFSYTGLTPQQCDILINKHHVYLLKNGRVSMCGVTTKNVDHFARSILDAITSTQK